ncbi:MAG: hypothetical protein H7Y06_10565 [Opitutaceae bacterium]|nr:hypothetical protein [Opitutaceae bacterium]
MLKRLGFLLLSSVLGLTAFVMTGCGGDSSGGTAGPAAGSSFAGSSISFNPTINFTNGTDLTYVNNEVGSPFPAAAVATAGTYTYVPNASFTAGTLTLTVEGITPPIVLDIGSFTQSGGNVTGFSIRYNGQSYPTTVTGTLPAYQAPSGGGGGGGAGESRASDIPSSMQGSFALTFDKSDTPAISGVPADATETTFVIGARTLAFNGRTLTNPIFYNGNALEWIFKDGAIWWAVSQAVGGGLNEINVQGPYSASSANAFYGQYNDRVPGDTVSVDVDGKFVAGSFFDALVNSTSESTSNPDPQTPKLTGTIQFSITGAGSLFFGVPTGGGGSAGYTLPFVSVNSTTVTYRFFEVSTSGGTDKDYTVVVTKDGSGKPTVLTATFLHTNGLRITTNTYGLIAQF